MNSQDPTAAPPSRSTSRHTARWIVLGLVCGVLAGLLFGESCRYLQVFGQAYVGLLQMTVLPYLVVSLTGKLGRLDIGQAQRLGKISLLVWLLLSLIGIGLVVATSFILPPIDGASFFTPRIETTANPQSTSLTMFIPTNVFRSLSDQIVPAVVVFCMFFGVALIQVPGKENLLDFLDLCGDGIGRINMFLVRLAPWGLFTLTADAAGTLRFDEISRLQAYLIMFALACALAAAVALPLLVSGFTDVRYRRFMHAAQEPLLTAIATGKLFVVLPQIIEKCEQLLGETDDAISNELGKSTANVVVPLAYPFPHMGKVLGFVFITFAGWYVGQQLSTTQTLTMAATGAVSSFASPLVTIPYLLDAHRLPQDLLPLFILPGFLTTRLADMVGVLQLMALTLIVTYAIQGQIRWRARQLVRATLVFGLCFVAMGAASRWYLSAMAFEYDLDRRLLSLELLEPHDDVAVYKSRGEAPSRTLDEANTLERIQRDKLLRVGYHPNHVPYCFWNQAGRLVGMDVQLVSRLATRLQVRLEFVPYEYDTLVQQLDSGEIDLAVGGLIIKPERSLRMGFSEPYQMATGAIIVPDHRRHQFDTWNDKDMPENLRLAVIYEDMAIAARRALPDVTIEAIGSPQVFFQNDRSDFDGLVMAAEEGAAWNVLFPEHTVVIPKPIIQRPVGMAVRSKDEVWLRFLDRWVDFERADGALDRLRTFWIEGGGTKQQSPRWCILRDVLHWIP